MTLTAIVTFEIEQNDTKPQQSHEPKWAWNSHLGYKLWKYALGWDKFPVTFSKMTHNFYIFCGVFSRDSKDRPIKKFVGCLPCHNPPSERYVMRAENGKTLIDPSILDLNVFDLFL